MRPDGLKKVYYSIREVSEETGVEPHVLRFWEKEFPMLRPRRAGSGNRAYRDRDIALIHDIKRLVWEERYTIQGACEQLRRERARAEAADAARQEVLPFADPRNQVLGELRQALLELKDLVAARRGPR